MAGGDRVLTKFASAEVLDARLARQGAGLVKDAHRVSFDYDPRPGFLYVRSRAISSRTNDNFDHFPGDEIKKAYRTFVGKPVFVNHHNDNHRRARGVIVDAALHEDTNPDGSEDTWVEVLMEVDAVRFPKLAQAILAGEIDRTSMGTDVEFSVCSVCNNKASTPLEYCAHIPKMKGMKVRRTTASGTKEDVLCYEKCYGLGFFENSLLVEEPADPTAFFLGVDDRGLQSTASKRTASSTASDGWQINGQPFSEGTWVEVEPDTWFRTGKYPEITSRYLVKRDGDKWRWEAQVLTSIGAPHENTGWQKGKAPSGTASTLEEAQRKAVDSLAKDNEFFRKYDERQKAQLSQTFSKAASRTAEMSGIISDDIAYEQMLKRDLLHPRGVADWDDPALDLLAGNGRDPGPLVDLDRFVRERRHLIDPYTRSPVSGSKKTALADFKVGDKIMWRHDAIGARSAIDGVVTAVDENSVTIADPEHGFEAKVTKAELDAGRWTIYAQGSRRTAAIEVPENYVFLRFDSHRAYDNFERRAGLEGTIYLSSFDKPHLLAVPPEKWAKYAEENRTGNGMKGITVLKRRPDLGNYMRPMFGSRTALNETLAPAQVDTLRDESCPVCGEGDSFDGDKCLVCGYLRPPDVFMEPDLEKARKVDLRQEQEAQTETSVPQDGAADPNQAPGADGEVGTNLDQPWLNQTMPKDPGAAPAAAEGGKPWEQRTRPKDSSDPAGAEEENADQPWKAKTRRKSAGKNSPHEGVDVMRPTLRALAEQQQVIDKQARQIQALRGVVSFVTEAAGLTSHPHVARLMKAAADENPAQPVGWAIDSPEAQGSEAPAQTTEEALAPSQGKDDPENIGETPNTDVSADATTSLDSTETVLDTPLDLNEQDVTKPVAGTDTLGEGERGGAGTNRTETEVRSGTGTNDVAFAETGWTTSSKAPSEGRTIAALRLARLRVQAGIETGDDLTIGTKIASSTITDEAIQTEIDTLAKVVQATRSASRQPTTAGRHLVPRAASQQVQRTMPSLSAEASMPVESVVHGPDSDEFLFE